MQRVSIVRSSAHQTIGQATPDPSIIPVSFLLTGVVPASTAATRARARKTTLIIDML